jgi:chromosome segregation ATPase
MTMATQQQPKNTASVKQTLQEQFSKVQQRLATAKQDIDKLAAQDREMIRQKADEIRARMQQEQEEAKKTRSEMSQWLQAKKEETEEKLASWRAKRDIEHLQRRADRAEEHAMNMVVNALIDADEAEVAMLDALEARLDADTAAAPAK